MSQTSQPEETATAADTSTTDVNTSTEGGAAPATPTTPKKRGRPRKQPVATPEGAEPPPKRRRGRPRKSETEAAKAAAAAAAGGAPAPAADAGAAAATGDAAAAGGETPKKKRGRPKKDPNADSGPPKKRGRPRKVPVEGAEAAKPADTTPKKRGRPRKNPVPVAPAATAAGTSTPAATSAAAVETKESDAVHGEPRMESRKRRRNASPAPEKDSRKRHKAAHGDDQEQEPVPQEEIQLDFEHLDRSSLKELQQYARQKSINMRLHGDTKADYMHAISVHQLNSWDLNLLKAEVAKRGINMDDYGSTNKRKMDYIHAIIDHRLGKDGEPLWTLWKEIYLVGTEWENYDSVFDVEWDFNHLKEALEEGGTLYEAGAKHPVYLFGVTEPQLLRFGDKERVVPIPAIVAVVSALPPPAQLGLKSVQKIEEELVPMKELKMDWVPYIPKAEWKHDPRSVTPRAFFLKTSQRREGLQHMKEEDLVKFNFALPYIFLPRAQEKPQHDTIVNVVTEVNGKGATFEFDWEMDDLDEIAEGVLKDSDLDPEKDTEKLEELKNTIKEAVKAEKIRIREEKTAWESRMTSISPEVKKALDELQILKFYPQNEYPDVSQNKVAFVNRYYGKADKVL